jgi:hypothetical protein
VKDAEAKCSSLLRDFRQHLHNKYNRQDEVQAEFIIL